MSITAAIVVFAMSWFMVFFIVLPIRHVSQADVGKVEPGTPRGAPATEVVGRKAKITTLVAIVVWAVVVGIIQSGAITIRDLDIRGVMHTPEE